MSIRVKWLGAFAFLSVDVDSAAPAKTLDIYFVDVEGGQSTLLGAPDGESLLIDTGWSGNGQSEPGDPAKGTRRKLDFGGRSRSEASERSIIC